MNISRTAIITILVLVLILLMAAFFAYLAHQRNIERQLAASPGAQALQSHASSTPFADFSGNNVDLGQYLGQVLVVNSWASWAPASSHELRLLAEVAQDYTDQEIVFLAINRSETTRTAESYLELIGVIDDVQLIVDADDRYYKAIGGYTMPETVFYDREGDVAVHARGPLTAAQIKVHIGTAIAQSDD